MPMLATSPMRFLRAWLLAPSAVPLASAAPSCKAVRGSAGEHVETLLTTGKTLLGQTLAYPAGAPAKVTADIISIDPGAETGWHEHDVPLLAYMLEGELTVDYGTDGTHVYREGDVIIEAIGTPHNGHNAGRGVVRMFAVFLGADGVPDTVEAEAPR
jgi:quercetin dioxygenase-like cupin family protein